MSSELQAGTDPVRRVSSQIPVAPGTPVERVWTALTELALMPRLHPQILAARWLDGAREASLGARFVTDNAHPDLGVWQATSRIVEFRPCTAIAWTIESAWAPPAVCRFDVVDGPEGPILRQTYLYDTRPGAVPPVG